MSIVKKHVELPTPPPGSPGMFRCAQDGLIAGIFKDAGLKDISQTELSGQLKCEVAENYWSFVSEVAGPVVQVLSTADAELKEAIKSEVFQLVNDKYPPGKVFVDCSALIIIGTK